MSKLYWVHPESDSCGSVDTIEELHEMIDEDGLVSQIDEDEFKRLVEAGFDH